MPAMPVADGLAVVPSFPRAHARTRRLAQRLAERFARVALGTAFLSAVASRFGLWGGGPGSFAAFERYTAEVVAFAPPAAIPFLARAATVAELGLGVALVLGIWQRAVALASALLLAAFLLPATNAAAPLTFQRRDRR